MNLRTWCVDRYLNRLLKWMCPSVCAGFASYSLTFTFQFEVDSQRFYGILLNWRNFGYQVNKKWSNFREHLRHENTNPIIIWLLNQRAWKKHQEQCKHIGIRLIKNQFGRLDWTVSSIFTIYIYPSDRFINETSSLIWHFFPSHSLLLSSSKRHSIIEANQIKYDN